MIGNTLPFILVRVVGSGMIRKMLKGRKGADHRRRWAPKRGPRYEETRSHRSAHAVFNVTTADEIAGVATMNSSSEFIVGFSYVVKAHDKQKSSLSWLPKLAFT